MIDAIRHVDVFDPATFREKRIDVLGGGATGSRVVLELAKLGLDSIHVWDGDAIESHNIANQVFGVRHIGQPKATALAALVNEQVGHDVVIAHPSFCDGTEKFGDVVFLLIDTMKGRKAIFKGAIKLKVWTKLLIETRMGVDEGRLYSINPMMPNHISKWEETLYDDEEAAGSACGSQVTVGSTAAILAGMAVWAMISWHQGKPMPNEILVYPRHPTCNIVRNF